MAKGEVLQMTQKEIDRLKVLHQALEKKITQVKAAEVLKLSREHVNRLCQKIKKEGDRAVIHGLRGRPSNHRFSDDFREKVIQRIKERYSDFGPTLATEKLLSEGFKVSDETIRQWMIEEGIWVPRAKGPEHREWRERKECPGEMVQLDGSEHDWFEGRREECILLASIDDASNEVFARFVEHESTKELMSFARSYVEKFGRPLSFYLDRNSIFVTTRQPTIEEELQDVQPLTQFTRAMEKDLDIEIINAHSPQAKGRVERLFGTLQDRLVKEMRLANISTIEEANRFLEKVYLPWHNKRFRVKPKNPTNLHRPLGKTKEELDAIFSIQDTRTLANDYTIRFKNRLFQVEKHQPFYLLPRTKVTVEERLDGSIRIRYKGKYLKFSEIEAQKIRKPTIKMLPLQTKPKNLLQRKKPKYIPPADHPWRKSFHVWIQEALARKEARQQELILV